MPELRIQQETAQVEMVFNCTQGVSGMSRIIDKTVLVTGCSTGIGFSTAQLLAEKGFHVLAGIRKEKDKEKLTASHTNITPVILDVTDERAVQDIARRINSEYRDSFWGIVNNAGVMLPAPLELADIDHMRHEMNVNYFGAVSLTKELLPLVKRVQGRIVNMSSMNGRMAMPAVGSYSATKFALEGFTDALRMEIAGAGVNVSLIEPGQIKTEIFHKALKIHKSISESINEEQRKQYDTLLKGIEAGLEMGKNAQTQPIQVAESVYEALTADKPAHRYVVGEDAKGFAQMVENNSSEEIDQQLLAFFGM